MGAGWHFLKKTENTIEFVWGPENQGGIALTSNYCDEPEFAIPGSPTFLNQVNSPVSWLGLFLMLCIPKQPVFKQPLVKWPEKSLQMMRPRYSFEYLGSDKFSSCACAWLRERKKSTCGKNVTYGLNFYLCVAHALFLGQCRRQRMHLFCVTG